MVQGELGPGLGGEAMAAGDRDDAGHRRSFFRRGAELFVENGLGVIEDPE